MSSRTRREISSLLMQKSNYCNNNRPPDRPHLRIPGRTVVFSLQITQINQIKLARLDYTHSCRFVRFVVIKNNSWKIRVKKKKHSVDSRDSWFQYLLWHHPFLWVPWVLCALIRTSIRAIRAECGEETHSASPSTHRFPFNLGYPWSANKFLFGWKWPRLSVQYRRLGCSFNTNYHELFTNFSWIIFFKWKMEGLEWKGVKKAATLIWELRLRCPTER